MSTCLRLDAPGGGGIANTGFWGVPVKARTTYRVSFYAKTDRASGASLIVSLESDDGQTTHASSAPVALLPGDWRQYQTTLVTSDGVTPSGRNRFVISTTDTGVFWFNLVSLFPPTFKDRPNGNRIDLMQLLTDLKPRFLRLPGGGYVQGKTLDDRFKWKETLGDLAQRPGNSGYWRYRASDGMGLLEMLHWCEDLGVEPILAVNSGYARPSKHPTGFPATGATLQAFIDEALDEIEYITGDITTEWGARRARDGHPAPFKLSYVEIGNEDGADIGGSYESRYVRFHDAIKARYPHLQLIATVGGHDEWSARFNVTQRTPDFIDEHFYKSSDGMQFTALQLDDYPRTGPKIFVGEWATHEGSPTTNFNAALGDAALMIGMERNADIIRMHCYAPLLANVNEGARQWPFNLIGYDTLTSYGSPSYHAQKIFSHHIGDRVISVTGRGIPTRSWQPALPKIQTEPPQPLPPARELPILFFSATRDTRTGAIFLKVVNTAATAQTVRLEIVGTSIAMEGTRVALAADPVDTNTLTEPTKIIPVITRLTNLGPCFTHTFAPYSINVLQFKPAPTRRVPPSTTASAPIT